MWPNHIKNSKLEPGYVDDRGYVPVEWWLCSTVMAGNPIEKENEGVASFFVGDPTSTKTVLFTDVLNVAEPEVLGKYRHAWPLIKVLDIGGSAISPNFNGEKGTEEVPPIPCHVHSGYICNGRCCGHGKLEAYFFPPLPKGKEVVGASPTHPGWPPVEFGARSFGSSDLRPGLRTGKARALPATWSMRAFAADSA